MWTSQSSVIALTVLGFDSVTFEQEKSLLDTRVPPTLIEGNYKNREREDDGEPRLVPDVCICTHLVSLVLGLNPTS